MADLGNTPDDKSWRIDNARHLKNLCLQFSAWKQPRESWDHDHCSACWVKFVKFDGPEIQHDGYTTCEDYKKGAHYDWICKDCFADLKDDMGWKVAE